MDTKINLNLLKRAIEKSWSPDTCYPSQKNSWDKNAPYVGQCAVTALVIQDFLKGKIVYTSNLHHYWNILPNGTIVDLTEQQFPQRIDRNEYKHISRDYILNSSRADEAETHKRYKIFKKRVLELL